VLREQPDQPTMIFMHHPPFSTGLADMDRINCRNGAAMAAVLRRFDNVERVVCGHHHRPITVRWGGTIGSVAPSTAHQVSLDLAPDARQYELCQSIQHRQDDQAPQAAESDKPDWHQPRCTRQENWRSDTHE
jgi:3',5'-cyclic AMP phosphodiesterase CpdA